MRKETGVKSKMEKKTEEKKPKTPLRLVVPWKRQISIKSDQIKTNGSIKLSGIKEGNTNKKVLRIGMKPVKITPLKSLSPVERKKKAAKKRKVKLQMAQGNNNGNHTSNENKIVLPKLQESTQLNSQMEHPLAFKPVSSVKTNNYLPSLPMRIEVPKMKENNAINSIQIKDANNQNQESKDSESLTENKEPTSNDLPQSVITKIQLMELPPQLPPPIISTKKENEINMKETKKESKKKEMINKKKKDKKSTTPKKRGRKPKPKYSLSNEKKDRVKQTMSFILKSINGENKTKIPDKNSEEKKPKKVDEKIIKKKGKPSANVLIQPEKIKDVLKECTM